MVSSLIADLLGGVSPSRIAGDDWEVDCRTIGADTNPHFLLLVRHRQQTNRSRVLLTTTDWQRAASVDAATRRLLREMDSEAFGSLVQLT